MALARTQVWAILVGCALMAAFAFTSAAFSQPAQPLAAASALPQDRLHFGLANDPSSIGWMTSSGVPWRYRYQYLSGGVNTGQGWETWNSPAGAFASMYMASSGANNYIPVFTYYELLQSLPSTGGNESDRDYNNLNNAATMNSYFGNFKLLMQQAAGYSKALVVHVEPDLWGYMEQRAAGGTAATVSAKVAGSGFSDVAGIPDTVQGFADALLKLRDLYAPNVVLGIHASAWGSGIDIASSRDPNINAASVADATAAFLNSAGLASNPYGSTWDLVFNDVDDHDAGWWEKQGADNQSFTHWWDPLNTTFPNFTRYLAWVAELKARTARPQIVWQVPVGNQYFLTMNNTCGHYQDNVGAYFIGHASDLFAAGLIAVMFGAGNGCQTSYGDAMGDGITNNGGAATTDLAGYCSACNVHTSTVSDDDGGYLRIFVGLYYNGQTSLGGSLASGPGAASCAAGSLDAFVLGGGGVPWRKTWNGTTWSGWLLVGGHVMANPSAVCRPSTTNTDLFVEGVDSALYHRVWNGSAWQPWENLGGSLTSGPGASSCAANNTDVFVLGGDGVVWRKTWNSTVWSGWLLVGGNVGGNPAAVCEPGTGVIHLFVEGTDGRLYHRTWTGSAWLPWDNLGGSLTSSAAAVSCAAGQVDAFVNGGDGVLWRKTWNGSTWSGWIRIGGSWTSDPGAVCQPGTTKIDLFERGPDGALWQQEISS